MVDTKISNYLVGIIFFTFIIVGSVSLISMFDSSLQNSTGKSIVEDTDFIYFNSSFNKLNDITSYTDDLTKNVENTKNLEYGVLGVLQSLISSSWITLKVTVTSLDFMSDAFRGATKIFGVPTWAVSLIISLVTIIIIYAIFAAIFQREL